MIMTKMKDHDIIRKSGNKPNQKVTVIGPSRTVSSQVVPTCLNHGLVVRPVGQSSSLLSSSLKSDVLLSNVHLLSTIQSPVIWPTEGFLRQALLGSDKSVKGGDKISSTGESSLSLEQSANSNATLVAISMASQTPLLTTNLSQQVIMLGELGSNQIILAGPGLPHVVPYGSGISSGSVSNSGISQLTLEAMNPAFKQIDIEATSTSDLEKDAPDLLVVDDHDSFNVLNINSPASNSTNDGTDQEENIKDFAVIQDKEFSTQESEAILHVQNPHQHLATLPDLINQHTSNSNDSNISDHQGDSSNLHDDSSTATNSSHNNRSSFIQENHVSEVVHQPPDGNGELGYTAHLLSELSDTGTLPTMSSSQVSSVLSALEPAEKMSQSNLGSLDSTINNKQRKSPIRLDLHLTTAPPSPEFVKVESSISDVTKPTATKLLDSDKSTSKGYKVFIVNSSDNEQLALFKCSNCGFLTLKETSMENHCQKMHDQQSDYSQSCGRRQIKCIGCCNIFHSKQALQVHLIQDHGVCTSEVSSMVSTIFDNVQKEEPGSDQFQTSLTKSVVELITSNGSSDITQEKEQLLYIPPNKKAHTATSVNLNSVITTASSVQSITSLPSLEIIVSSIGESVASPCHVSTKGIKRLPRPLPSANYSAVSTSDLFSHSRPLTVLSSSESSNHMTTITSITTTTITTTSTTSITTSRASSKKTVASDVTSPTLVTTATTTTTTPATASPTVSVFIKSVSENLFPDENLDKNIFSEDKAGKNETQFSLKNEKELKDALVEDRSSVDLVREETSVSGENLNKKRGRPRGSQTLRLVRTKYQSTEVKSEKDSDFRFITIRCGLDGCAARLHNEANMVYHRQCHSGKPGTFQCPECSHVSSHWSCLTLHLWKLHKIDMELYSCDKCDYKTNSHSKLINLHNRIHGNERPFLCDLCGKGFKTPKQLRNHKSIHKVSMRNLLSCDICGRKVSDARYLRLHIENVHNKRRPFHCSFCGYTSASRSALSMHSRQHTGEKPFKCDECNYSTADHNSLRRHKMRHSGNKPYQCPHCSYACIQSTTYKAHLKNKHPGLDEGLMFSCPECSFRTIKKDNLLAHLAEHTINDGLNNNKTQSRNSFHKKSSPTSTPVKTPVGNLQPKAISTISSSHLTVPASLSSDNALALQSLVKKVSSSIIPTDRLEIVMTDNTQNLHQETTLVSLGVKKGISLNCSAESSNNQLPVAGLAHGELIISDTIRLEDSDSEL